MLVASLFIPGRVVAAAEQPSVEPEAGRPAVRAGSQENVN
jgi:hypothetical protein